MIQPLMVAIHLPLDSLSGRGSYGMKGEIPLNQIDVVLLDGQEVLILSATLFFFSNLNDEAEKNPEFYL